MLCNGGSQKIALSSARLDNNASVIRVQNVGRARNKSARGKPGSMTSAKFRDERIEIPKCCMDYVGAAPNWLGATTNCPTKACQA